MMRTEKWIEKTYCTCLSNKHQFDVRYVYMHCVVHLLCILSSSCEGMQIVQAGDRVAKKSRLLSKWKTVPKTDTISKVVVVIL